MLSAATDYCDGGDVGVVSLPDGVRPVWSVVVPVVEVEPDVVGPVVSGVIVLSGVMVVPDVVVPDVDVSEDRGPTGPVISG